MAVRTLWDSENVATTRRARASVWGVGQWRQVCPLEGCETGNLRFLKDCFMASHEEGLAIGPQ